LGWLPKLWLKGVRLPVGAIPVTLKFAMCGLPGALSLTATVPVTSPSTVGVACSVIVQKALTARIAGQSLVCENGRTVRTPEIDAAAVPLFLAVIEEFPVAPSSTCPKLTAEELRTMLGAVPVPDRPEVVGVGTALEATESIAFSKPVAPGLNTTTIAQNPPTATDAGQLFVWE